MARIYTRTGDQGETCLFTGERVSKDEPRLEAVGALDELVAHLGAAKAEAPSDGARARIEQAQSDLYRLMAELASPGRTLPDSARLPADAVTRLEGGIDALDAGLPPLHDFVVPGGSRCSAALHVARAVCRRAERRVVTVGRMGPAPDAAVVYLNRLSDLLFVLARAVDHDAGQGDRTFKDVG